MQTIGFRFPATLFIAILFMTLQTSVMAQKNKTKEKDVKVTYITNDSIHGDANVDTIHVDSGDKEKQIIIIKSRKTRDGKMEIETSATEGERTGPKTVTIVKYNVDDCHGKKIEKHVTTTKDGNTTTVIIKEEKVKEPRSRKK